jgi:hypothetical protein
MPTRAKPNEALHALFLFMIGWFYPIVLVLFFGLIIWADWLLYLNGMPPREGWLAKAAHGIGVIVCGGYILAHNLVPYNYLRLAYRVYGVLIALRVFWVLVGSARAQIHGDAHLIGRAIVKLAVGCSVFGAWHFYQWQTPWPYRGWIDPCVQVIALWCWATGLTKFVICCRPLPRLAAAGTPNAYGGARFREGVGLQGGGNGGFSRFKGR